VSRRFPGWFRQAERDLAQATESRDAGRHELGVLRGPSGRREGGKALHLKLGQEASRHVVARLVRELALEVDPTVVEKGRVLDDVSAPARYPNGHDEGAPFEHFGPLESETALRHAREIVEFVRLQMA